MLRLNGFISWNCFVNWNSLFHQQKTFLNWITELNKIKYTGRITDKDSKVTITKKDGTPEGIARIENIEELLNGMRDFVEEQKELADTTGSLAEFLEDVAEEITAIKL